MARVAQLLGFVAVAGLLATLLTPLRSGRDTCDEATPARPRTRPPLLLKPGWYHHREPLRVFRELRKSSVELSLDSQPVCTIDLLLRHGGTSESETDVSTDRLKLRLAATPDKRQATIFLAKWYTDPGGMLESAIALLKESGYAVIVVHRGRGDGVEIEDVIDSRE